MLRSDRRLRRVLTVVILLSASCAGGAVPTLDARIGFASTVVARLNAPVRVTVSGLEETISGSLRIVQYVGILSESSEEVSIELTSGTVDAATYESSIPIYDPLNPVDVILTDSNGHVLAAQQLNFRLFTRSAPFPLVCETALDLGGTEIRVGPAELPWEWWAYEAVDSLWLGGASISRPAWEAISRWVLAGGSLVMFTGSDVFKFDPTFLEALFPLEGATLEATAEGVPFVEARLPADAETLLWRDDGTPLVHVRSFGAGSVAVVTVRAADLTVEETRRLASRTRSSDLISMQLPSWTLQGQIRVPRPNYLVAPIVVMAMIGGLVGGRAMARRRLHVGGRAGRGGLVVVAIVAVAASVFSGFYTNRAKQLVELYQCNTILDVYVSVGTRIVSHTIFAPGFPLDIGLPRERLSVPTYALIRTVRRAAFGSRATADVLEVPLAAGESRHLRSYGDARPSIELTVSGREATIENHLERTLDRAYVIVDGLLYRVGEVPPGVRTVALQGGVAAWSLRGVDRSGYADGLKAIEAAFSFEQGGWVVAVTDETSIRSGVQTEEKVRDVHYYVVQGVTE